MRGKVNNGRRVQLDIADFFGMAGLVEANGVTTLAYRSNRVGRPLAPGSVLDVDGEQRTVLKVTPSEYVERMILVTLQ